MRKINLKKLQLPTSKPNLRPLPKWRCHFPSYPNKIYLCLIFHFHLNYIQVLNQPYSTVSSEGENHQPRIKHNLQWKKKQSANPTLPIAVEKNTQWKTKTQRRTGSRIWQPTTSESGMIKAHWYPGICHSKGTTFVVKITIIAMHRKHITKESLKRRHIAGTRGS